MITETTVKIIQEFCELNARAGGICSEWCIGVTDDAERYLFNELGIPRDYRWCIHRCALSAKEAWAIVQGFQNIGFEASLRQVGNEAAIHVFAYRKMPVEADVASRNNVRV